MDVGLALREIRKRSEKKQQDVADEAGISVAYMSMIENGSRLPTISVLKKISQVYGVPLPAILWLGIPPKEVKKNTQAFHRANLYINDYINELLY